MRPRFSVPYGWRQVLFKVVQEGSDALQGGLALALYLYVELDFGLADATQVLYVVQFGD